MPPPWEGEKITVNVSHRVDEREDDYTASFSHARIGLSLARLD